MKSLTRIILVLMVILGALLAKSALAGNVSEIKITHNHLFVLKANKQDLGATVEIYYSNGDLITSQKINKRRMIIDFRDTRAGEYTIRIVRGNKKQEFQYFKK
ncbi:MAG TPA: hypothetical protein VFU05_09435 [Cyclobacteriaceae bacterium]|nr:hypothetical protein [Cyclobacteriaceae bacterium]